MLHTDYTVKNTKHYSIGLEEGKGRVSCAAADSSIPSFFDSIQFSGVFREYFASLRGINAIDVRGVERIERF